MSQKWRRRVVEDWIYELLVDGMVRASIERHDPPNNSHFSLWTVGGYRGHFATMREAKAFVVANLAVGGSLGAQQPPECAP